MSSPNRPFSVLPDGQSSVTQATTVVDNVHNLLFDLRFMLCALNLTNKEQTAGVIWCQIWSIAQKRTIFCTCANRLVWWVVFEGARPKLVPKFSK